MGTSVDVPQSPTSPPPSASAPKGWKPKGCGTEAAWAVLMTVVALADVCVWVLAWKQDIGAVALNGRVRFMWVPIIFLIGWVPLGDDLLRAVARLGGGEAVSAIVGAWERPRQAPMGL